MNKLFICFTTILLFSNHGVAVDLVKGGKPVADIVVAKSAPASVHTAARELQRHLEKISGAKLPIVTAPSEETANHAYVGKSEFTDALGFSLDDVKRDGFKIAAKDNHVIVAGKEIDNYSKMLGKFGKTDIKARQKKWETLTGEKWRRPCFQTLGNYNEECGLDLLDGTGTLYGVYALLEQLGWRWYMPDPDIGIVYPSLSDVSIKSQTTMRQPEFAIRYFDYGAKGQFTHELLWFKSMGLGASRFVPFYHALGRLTSFNQKEQPQEYFGKVNGKIDHAVPKLTSERLKSDFVRYQEFFHEMFPEIDQVCVGQPDGWSVMDEEDSAAGWDKIADRGPRGRFTDYYWDFLMDVRERIMKKHPDKTFTAFAYSRTTRPPTNVKKVPENVMVSFVQQPCNWMLGTKQQLEWREKWLEMMSRGDQLFFGDFYCHHATPYKYPPIPVIFTNNMERSFKGLYDRSVGGKVGLGWTTGKERKDTQLSTAKIGISHLMLLLYSKYFWDRNFDQRKFIDEYCELFFGPAKEEMREFYGFAEEVWTRPESRTITANGGFLKKTDIDKYFDILARAKAKCGDSIYGKRVDYIATEMEPLKRLHEKLQRTGPEFRCHLASSKDPVIDGDLGKPFWREKDWTFIPLRDRTTGEIPKHVRTNASFRWLPDNSALVVAVECLEPKMDKLRSKCGDCDSLSIFSDDNVEILLETAKGIAPKIVINPNGVVWDSCVTEKVEDLPYFYKVRDVAVKKLPDRWTIEAKIDAKPISGEKPSEHFPWGVNVHRQRLAGNTPEYYMLSPGEGFKDRRCMGNLWMK